MLYLLTIWLSLLPNFPGGRSHFFLLSGPSLNPGIYPYLYDYQVWFPYPLTLDYPIYTYYIRWPSCIMEQNNFSSESPCCPDASNKFQINLTNGSQAVGSMSGYRCVSDCRSRGLEFDLVPVPNFPRDWSWNNFYGHSPFRWIIQEGLLSVTSESMCTKYWLTTCSSLPGKSVVRWTDRPAMTISLKQQKKQTMTNGSDVENV